MIKISLHKLVKEKNQYQKIIDTSFSQLKQPVQQVQEQTIDEKISKFFNDYEELFYNIPKEGDTNSHQYLIKQSTDYVGTQQIDDDVQALLDEIASLRETNLGLQQQIIDLSTNK